MVTTVVNMRDAAYGDDLVYCGRVKAGTAWRWGNPATHLRYAMREGMILVNNVEETCAWFEQWFLYSQDARAVRMRRNIGLLVDKRLGCFCVPRHCCHCETLAKAANEYKERGSAWLTSFMSSVENIDS